MGETLKTVGIVLSAKDFFESDRIITLYSFKYGKMRAILKGARKITSKLAGYFDNLNFIEIQFTKGKSFDIIIGAELKKTFPKIKKDLKKIALSFYIVELIDKLTFSEEPHIEVYDLLSDFFDVLEDIETEKIELLRIIFESKLLEELGYRPDLSSCVMCKKKGQFLNIDFEHGGIICDDCLKSSGQTSKISENTLKSLNAFEKLSIPEILNVKGIAQDFSEISKILHNYNFYTFQKIYKSEEFMSKLT